MHDELVLGTTEQSLDQQETLAAVALDLGGQHRGLVRVRFHPALDHPVVGRPGHVLPTQQKPVRVLLRAGFGGRPWPHREFGERPWVGVTDAEGIGQCIGEGRRDLDLPPGVGVTVVPMVVGGGVVLGHSGDHDRGITGGELFGKVHQTHVEVFDLGVEPFVVVRALDRGQLTDDEPGLVQGDADGRNRLTDALQGVFGTVAGQDVLGPCQQQQVMGSVLRSHPAVSPASSCADRPQRAACSGSKSGSA